MTQRIKPRPEKNSLCRPLTLTPVRLVRAIYSSTAAGIGGANKPDNDGD